MGERVKTGGGGCLIDAKVKKSRGSSIEGGAWQARSVADKEGKEGQGSRGERDRDRETGNEGKSYFRRAAIRSVQGGVMLESLH